jgi:hypothetical protein
VRASTKAIKGFNKANTYPSILNIEVSLPNNTWLNINDYVQSHPLSSDSDLGRPLRVTGYVSRPYFLEETGRIYYSGPLSSYSGIFLMLIVSESSYCVCKIRRDTGKRPQSMMAFNTLNPLALLVDEGNPAKNIMGTYLILVPNGSHFHRVGINVRYGRKHQFDDRRPKEDLSSKEWEFLQRSDDDFFARKRKRTLILT